jgi:hypothetical protein
MDGVSFYPALFYLLMQQFHEILHPKLSTSLPVTGWNDAFNIFVIKQITCCYDGQLLDILISV